jgi:dihydrofolate synthase/folylpolyglutamate synthase
MSFEEAQAYLDSLGIDAMKSLAPSLHRMEALCEALDHPERSLDAIHITGTNGKTSTARIASALLGGLDLKVGSYTSPHLQTIRERIALNGEPITEDVFADAFDHLTPFVKATEKKLDERLSYFEILTGLFFLWASENCDVAVVEVGLGGRWDATNVMDAPVAVITNIALDHVQMLGETRAQIAGEKAGIVKLGSRVVTGERDPEMLAILGSGPEAELLVLDRDFAVEGNDLALGGRYLTVRTTDRLYEDLILPLHGSHQGRNAAIALQAVTSFLPEGSLSPDTIATGLRSVSAPGRLEFLRNDRVVLDVAHNPEGVSALVASLREAFPFEKVVFVAGILADKDHVGMLQELTRVPGTAVFTEARSVRSRPAAELVAAASELGMESVAIEDVSSAIDAALARASGSDLIVVTGSHYVVGEARTHLLGSATSPDSTGIP